MTKMPPLPGFTPTDSFSPIDPTTARPGLFGSSKRRRQFDVIPDIAGTSLTSFPFASPPSALGPDAVAALASRTAVRPPLSLQAWALAAGAGTERDRLLDNADVPFGPPEPAAARHSYRSPPPEIIALAQASQRSTGIPASVNLAQWILESHWGKNTPTGSNNYFGMKEFNAKHPGVVSRTTEYTKTRLDQRFRKFSTPSEGWAAHDRLLTGDKRYAKAMSMTHDPNAFVDAIAKHYATAPDYAQSLKALMRSNHLYDYDVQPSNKP